MVNIKIKLETARNIYLRHLIWLCLVLRSEVGAEFSKRFYKLNRLVFEVNDPLQTTPIYNYFLAAQESHVIKTWLNIFQ